MLLLCSETLSGFFGVLNSVISYDPPANTFVFLMTASSTKVTLIIKNIFKGLEVEFHVEFHSFCWLFD